MRTAAVFAHSPTRAVTQGGQGPPPLPRGKRLAKDYRQARHPIGTRRCGDYCVGQAGPGGIDRAPGSENRASRRRHRSSRESRGPAFDGSGDREGAHRASNPQRSSEGAHWLAVAAGLHRASPRSRNVRPNDVRKKSRGTGAPSTELEERYQEVPGCRRGRPREARGYAARQARGEQVAQDASGRSRRRVGDHSLPRRAKGSPQLFGRTSSRNRPQKPDPRPDGRSRSSDHRRSQIWREDRSCATPGATFVPADFHAPSLRKPNDLPKSYANQPDENPRIGPAQDPRPKRELTFQFPYP